jgi:hypothetical protein
VNRVLPRIRRGISLKDVDLSSRINVMAVLVPPPAPPAPPIIAVDDYDRRRFRVRMVKLTATFITILISGWLFTLGMVPGILGLIVAKHILIAIYLMGSGIHDPRLLPPQT